MQIQSLQMRPSILHLLVFGFFGVLLLVYVALTGNSGILIWALPSLVLLLLIPMALTWMSQKEYAELIPVYEESARNIKIRDISEKMIGKPVRIEGLVEEVRFRFLNRPHFIVADKTGVIPVKMFTAPTTDVRKDDIAEVYGQVIRRYIVAGDPIINGVLIRKLK